MIIGRPFEDPSYLSLFDRCTTLTTLRLGLTQHVKYMACCKHCAQTRQKGVHQELNRLFRTTETARPSFVHGLQSFGIDESLCAC